MLLLCSTVDFIEAVTYAHVPNYLSTVITVFKLTWCLGFLLVSSKLSIPEIAYSFYAHIWISISVQKKTKKQDARVYCSRPENDLFVIKQLTF
jgi:hypothetical protein